MYFGLLFAGIGAFVVGMGFYYIDHDIWLDLLGKSAQGTVLQLYQKESDDNTSSYVDYRFADSTDHLQKATAEVSSTTYGTLAVDEHVPVEYLPSNPGWCRMRGAISAKVQGLEAIVFGIIFGGIGGFIAWAPLVYELKLYRLSRKGTLARGTVVRLEEDKSASDEDRIPKLLVYSFTDAIGVQQTGRSRTLGLAEEKFWEERVGEELPVYYNPKDSTDNVPQLSRSSTNRITV